MALLRRPAGGFAIGESRKANLRLSLANVTPAVFLPHIGTNFETRTAEGVYLSLVLAKITERPAQAHIAQFFLIFKGPANIEARNGTCVMRHRTLGSLELFIVPIGTSDNNISYQACFSRLVNERGARASAELGRA